MNQLLELLTKSIAPGVPNALAAAVTTASSQSRPSVGAQDANDARASALSDVIEHDLVSAGDNERTLRFQALKRRLMSAGRPDSGLASFRDKASLIELLDGLRGGNTRQQILTPSSIQAHFESFADTGAGSRPAPIGAGLSLQPALLPMHRDQAPAHDKDSRMAEPEVASRQPRPQPSVTSSATAPRVAALSEAELLTGAGVLPPSSEAALVRDLLFVFQGIDGHYVRWRPSASSDAAEPPAARRRRAPRGEGALPLLPPSLGGTGAYDSTVCEGFACAKAVDGHPVPLQTAHAVQSLGELGWLYRRIQGLLDAPPNQQGARPARSRTGPEAPTGLVRNAFSAAVRAELDVYFRQLATLDAQLSAQGRGAEGAWTLQRLRLWAQEPMQTLRSLAVVTEACEGLRGCALAGALAAHCDHGDPSVRSLVSRLLRSACAPIRGWIRDWISSGDLPASSVSQMNSEGSAQAGGSEEEGALPSSAASEFFITCTVATHNAFRAGGRPSDLDDDGRPEWQPDAFTVDLTQIPCFFSRELAHAILAAGRAVHFVRHACGDAAWVRSAIGDAVAAALGTASPPANGAIGSALAPAWGSPDDATVSAALAAADASASGLARTREEQSRLAAMSSDQCEAADAFGVDEAARLVAAVRPLADRRLVHLLLHVHGLGLHLDGLQRYVLFAAGDFASTLVSALAQELDRPGTAVASSRHMLEAALEGACRACGGGDDPDSDPRTKQLTDRLNVTLHTASPGDSGWDVFALSYALIPPLSSVVSADAQEQLARVSAFLWSLKRSEFTLGNLWSGAMTASHSLRKLGHAGLDRLLHCCHALRSEMASATSTLGGYLARDVLAGEGASLQASLAAADGLDALLSAVGLYVHSVVDKCFLAPRTSPVAARLRAICELVLAFSRVQEGLISAAQAQVAARRAHQAKMAQRHVEGACRTTRRHSY